MVTTTFTLLAVHAHPDDECLLTGGVLARCAAEGGRTVLVTCTDGAVGEIADPSLATPENLAEVRSRELDESARMLRIGRLERLGYRDSGMAGTADNEHPASFQQADLESAVEKVVRIVRREQPHVIVTYDENGGYGHPDHIRAHQVAVAAFDAAGDATRFRAAGPTWSPSRLFYAVIPRSSFQRMGERMREAGIEVPFRERGDSQEPPFGVPEESITTRVDVSGYTETKRASILAHKTQLGTMDFLLRLPSAIFDEMFALEYFQLVRGPREGAEASLFGGL
jgi:N-acetyl-1-D-myo-inositol-2-amino-2-deoxy-alpha-D-glucopyranoside deacetylase